MKKKSLKLVLIWYIVTNIIVILVTIGVLYFFYIKPLARSGPYYESDISDCLDFDSETSEKDCITPEI